MKSKTSKILLILLCVVLVVFLLMFVTYKVSFAPKSTVTPISTKVEINNKELIKKFLPDNFSLSLKEIYVESTTSFSDRELTELFILALSESPEAMEFVDGLRVSIVNGKIDILLHINFNGIPLECNLTFTAMAKDGMGIFHYESGKVGFIDIKKDWIFSNIAIEDNSIISVDKASGDLILAFDGIKQLEVRNVSTFKNELNITFRGTLRFWDWLK
ncbi:MAG: hypothetical protein ACRC7N_16810 [Clostridium sp.]